MRIIFVVCGDDIRSPSVRYYVNDLVEDMSKCMEELSGALAMFALNGKP